MVANKRHLEGNPRFERIAQRGAIAAVRHRHDQVGLARILASQFPAHRHAHSVHITSGDRAVRPREVDVLENAEGAPRVIGKRLDAPQALTVNHQNLARSDVTHKRGLDQIERAGLARQHPGVPQPPERQRPESMRITNPDQLLLRLQDQRVGALDSTQCLDQAGGSPPRAGAGHQVQDDLTVHSGL